MPAPRTEAGTVAALAARPRVTQALAAARARAEAIAAETVHVTEIPAPTFHEGARAAYVAERFAALGLQEVEIAPDRNVYALLSGEQNGDRPAVAAFAHLDTVFGPEVPVRVTRRDDRLYAPGVGDNSAGVAGLISALATMQEVGVQPARPVWIVGTVGEEGLGNLAGAQAATERLAGISAVLAVEGSFFGRVSHTAVGSRRLRVRVRAEGGHSWHDFGRPSALHALVRAAAQIVALDVPTQPRTTFNIGQVRGGTGVNVIAECAEMLLDMRSVDARSLDRLSRRVHQILDAETTADLSVHVEVVGDRPAGSIPASHPLVQTCSAVLEYLGVTPQFAAASTDANAPLGRGIPALTLGVTRGGGAHTLGEWIELAPMVRGVQQLVLLLCALAEPDALQPSAR